MIKNLVTFFYRPYDFLKDRRVKALLSFGTTAFAGVFLWFFGPFGLILYPAAVQSELILYYCTFGLIISVANFYLLQNILIKNHVVGTTILWLVWNMLVIGLSNFFVFEIVVGKGVFHWRGLHIMELQTLLVGSLPVLFTVVLYNSYYLKKRIRIINQINSDLSRFKSEGAYVNGALTLSSSSLSEVITVDSQSLLYLASADNYVEVYRIENGQMRHSLLRNTLSEAEKQLVRQSPAVRRCHNSYIVNLNRVKTVSGNEAGYKIMLEGVDSMIPVSRKYKDNVFAYLRR
ncbi:MAG TPA: LytTR family DNA-binding domain-containing protein [Candidatus Acidoferrales bacterium]|nr:LytTR family DNA-binding domain-containing protein [Candidatus Acidoferrales bacterium]